jgi:PAS domain-containing protein
MVSFNALYSDLAAQLGEERAQHAQAKASLAEAVAKVAKLEQRLAAAAIEAKWQHLRLSALASRLPMGVLVADNSNQVQFVNQAYQDLLRPAQALAELANSSDLAGYERALAPLNEHQELLAADQERQVGGQAALQEEIVLPDGRVLARDYLVLEEDAGHLVCYRDVTEHRRRRCTPLPIFRSKTQIPSSA